MLGRGIAVIGERAAPAVRRIRSATGGSGPRARWARCRTQTAWRLSVDTPIAGWGAPPMSHRRRAVRMHLMTRTDRSPCVFVPEAAGLAA